MPDEDGNVKADEETTPETTLHAHAEDADAESQKGEIGSGEHQDASRAENTGGATSGGPGGDAEGDPDPSQED